MKIISRFTIVMLTVFACVTVYSQTGTDSLPAIQKTIFENDEIVQLELNGNIRELLNDRSEKSSYHKIKLVYNVKQPDTANVEMKTRGHFRKMSENCTYPPLLINFKKSKPGTRQFFGKSDKLKLVMPCVNKTYLVREWLVYKLYNLITPCSLQATLVKLQMNDTKRGKSYPEMFGILIENEDEMAERNHQVIVKRKVMPKGIELNNFLTMAMFQYLIGNTDWSIEFTQNMLIMAADSTSTPLSVAYDFDHSGMVDAPYAHPAEALKMGSVTERRYRGYCITDLTAFNPIIAHYNILKQDIYNLYSNNTLIDEKYKKSILKYLDEFYTTINSPELFKNDFLYPCDKYGTGNVIIKGLRKD